MDALSSSDFARQLPNLARRQLADFDARKPGGVFAEDLVVDVAQGYALQAAVADLRCARGEQIIGYKVGCTSPTIREQLGIDHCVTGRIYDTERHVSGVELSRSAFAKLAIEGELAVELSHEPSAEDFASGGIPTCVARVFPVIELHHYVMRGKVPSAGELIAHNAIHGGFVAGEGVRPENIEDEILLEIFMNDEMIESCQGSSLVTTIRTSLRWLMGIVHERGDRLGAGQVILTGSIPPLIPVHANCLVRVEASSFGSVDAKFTGDDA